MSKLFNIKPLLSVIALLLLLLLQPSLSLASGRYSGGQSGAAGGEGRVLYSIGKNIYKGKTHLSPVTDPDKQIGILDKLQQKLPQSIKSRVKLTDYAGQLTEKQLLSLKHYLSVRYKIDISGL